MEVVQPPSAEPGDEFCSSLLSRFGKSDEEHHQHVCSAVKSMYLELKDQNLALSPVAYFGATCSALDRLCSVAESSGNIIDALIFILSMVIDRLPPVILIRKNAYLSELLIRVLCAKSVGANGIIPGIKIASRLLSVNQSVIFEDVSQLYCFIIGCIADDRAKVRKQSHLCLCDMLKKNVQSSVNDPVSEAITNAFEKYLLLAGGSNSTAPDGKNLAQGILYILDALKICLPYMSSKSLLNILTYFKTLLQIRHPLVTRRIIDGLYALCFHSEGEIPSDLLLNLLCSLAELVISEESSADSMTFIAHLFDVGMKRVLSSNKKLCALKLPIVFKALKAILHSGHEGPLVAAVATFKSLIDSCIDESLITQGVNNVKDTASSTTGRIVPTVIEKVCETIESLLDYHYETVWNMSFEIVSTMFDKLGRSSFYLLQGTLKNLADMQKLPERDSVFRKQLHECIGVALAAMGPEHFLCLLPLNLDALDIDDANLWLFHILKQYTVCAHLSFFTKSILPMALRLKRRSAELNLEGKLHLSRYTDGIVYSLWSLLPSFCNYSLDTAESFKGLEATLCTALKEEPDLRGVICSSLQILVQQNKKVLEGKVVPPAEIGILEKRGVAMYDSHVALANLAALKSSAPALLQVLKELYLYSSNDSTKMLLVIPEL
ncbi:hypothetical protein M569_09087 [Genlisea aurea]|uniref:Uncharacterized protein n=1 Tax=Genlisea aurea TaxID=192259 RepID=S8CFL7_9LAMI|nr:hypothetical protein M569_09087 [Genlisea aurea]